MANLKRQAEAVDGVMRTPELTSTAQHYSAMARRHMTVSFDERMAMPTRKIRYLNNLAKACALDTCARAVVAAATQHSGPRPPVALKVADIACGRGQDATKMKYAAAAAGSHVAAYFAMDLAAENIVSSRIIADQYLGPEAETIDIQAGDMCTPEAYAFIPDASVNMVTCQLALHYLFRDKASLRTFFAQAARVLQPGGVLMVSYTDGRAIVRRARNAMPADVLAHTHSVVTYTGTQYSFTVPTDCLARTLPSPFGLQYVFSLPGCVEDVPEYLVHEGVVCAVAKEAGFQSGPSMRFDDAAKYFLRRRRFQEIAHKMKCNVDVVHDTDALDVASLYRFNVFAKSKEVLVQWDKCLFT